jgi:hypothetical protein
MQQIPGALVAARSASPAARRETSPLQMHALGSKQKQLELVALQIMSCSETTGWGRAALIWSDPHTSSHHCCSRTNADQRRHRPVYAMPAQLSAGQASSGKPASACAPRLAMAGRCGLSRRLLYVSRRWGRRPGAGPRTGRSTGRGRSVSCFALDARQGLQFGRHLFGCTE